MIDRDSPDQERLSSTGRPDRRRLLLWLLGAAAGGALGLAPEPVAAQRRRRRGWRREMRRRFRERLLGQGRGRSRRRRRRERSIAEIIPFLERRVHGEVLDVQPWRRRGAPVYAFKVLVDGYVRHFIVDPRTMEIRATDGRAYDGY